MTLYEYQRVGASFLVNKERCILGDDMGLGKTPQAICGAEEVLRNHPGRVLIICPLVVKNVWKREVEKWYPGATVHVCKPGIEGARAGGQANSTFVVTHFEQFRDNWDFFATESFRIIVIDEAHRVKNRKAKVREALKSYLKWMVPRYVWFLTGTPILNRIEELWSLLNFVDKQTYSSYWKWVDEHAKQEVVTDKGGRPILSPSGRVVKAITGVRDPERLKEQLSHVLLRRLKSEVLDLPPETVVNLEVELSKVQRKMYEDLRDEMYTILSSGKEVSAVTVLSQILRLKQVCVSPALIDPSIPGLPGPKWDELETIMEDKGDQKILIASQFATAVRRTKEALGDRCVLITGEESEKERTLAVERLQEDPSVDALGITTTCGIGITCTAASLVFMFDEHWTPGINRQLIDRVNRVGQTLPVTIYRPRVKGTVEAWIAKMNVDKQELFDLVIPVHSIKDALLSREF